jgi:hypothetical protein
VTVGELEQKEKPMEKIGLWDTKPIYAFSKHSLKQVGYFGSQQNALSKHSLQPVGYFEAQ